MSWWDIQSYFPEKASYKWAATWDFQQRGMCDQQRLRSACPHAQYDQSLSQSLKYSMTVKVLTKHYLEFLSLKGSCMPHCWKSHVKYCSLSCRAFNSFLTSHNFFPLLITFANRLDPDQDRQNVCPDLDPNSLTFWQCLEFFWKVSRRQQKH